MADSNIELFRSGRELEEIRNLPAKRNLIAAGVLGSIPLAVAIKEGLLSDAGREIGTALVTFARFMVDLPVK